MIDQSGSATCPLVAHALFTRPALDVVGALNFLSDPLLLQIPRNYGGWIFILVLFWSGTLRRRCVFLFSLVLRELRLILGVFCVTLVGVLSDEVVTVGPELQANVCL